MTTTSTDETISAKEVILRPAMMSDTRALRL
ncbi:MAG: hypothetical protein QOF66_4250 [Mycobacterium sp.]|nr:hypothetical protein [Mycobacterium sp.]